MFGGFLSTNQSQPCNPVIETCCDPSTDISFDAEGGFLLVNGPCACGEFAVRLYFLEPSPANAIAVLKAGANPGLAGSIFVERDEDPTKTHLIPNSDESQRTIDGDVTVQTGQGWLVFFDTDIGLPDWTPPFFMHRAGCMVECAGALRTCYEDNTLTTACEACGEGSEACIAETYFIESSALLKANGNCINVCDALA